MESEREVSRIGNVSLMSMYESFFDDDFAMECLEGMGRVL
jgi:hypothetical protein